MHPQKMVGLARTRDSRWFRLDLGCVSKMDIHERIMGNSHVGVSVRVFSTMASNTLLAVALASLKLSAPAMAADEYEVKAPGAAPPDLTRRFRRDLSTENFSEGMVILTPPLLSVTLLAWAA